MATLPGMDGTGRRLLIFGTFELDVDRQELRRNGAQVVLPPQPCQVLIYLAERQGEVVTREALRRHLWGDDTYVESDLGLNSCIRKIRRALRDDAQSPRFVETLPKRGYLFLAPVEVAGISDDAVPLASVHVPTNAGRSRTARRAWGLVAVALAIAGVFLVRALTSGEAGRAGPATALRHVAVLPIEDLRGDDPATPFAAGLTEELLLRLARRLPAGISVLDMSSTRHFMSGGTSPTALGPEFLLRASIRGDATRLRVVAHLVRADSGEAIWTEEFDAAVGEELETQERIATAAAAALGGELHARVAPPDAPQLRWVSESTTPEASEAYLKGLYLVIQGGRDDLDRAIPFLEDAIALDPELAAAHGALARAYVSMVFGGSATPADGFSQARAAAHRALGLDPDLVDALVSLGYIELYFDRDLDAARASLTRARDLAPGFARPHSALASLLAVAQQHRRAVAEARLARDLDPMGQSVNADLCWYLVYADLFDEAVAECERSLELAPTNQWTLVGLAEAHLGLGDEARAIETLYRAMGMQGAPPGTVAEIWGRVRQALESRNAADAFTMATIMARSGDPEAAVAALEQAARDDSFWMVYMRIDPRLDPLHGMAPFEELAADLGLPPSPFDGSL